MVAYWRAPQPTYKELDHPLEYCHELKVLGLQRYGERLAIILLALFSKLEIYLDCDRYTSLVEVLGACLKIIHVY